MRILYGYLNVIDRYGCYFCTLFTYVFIPIAHPFAMYISVIKIFNV